MDISAYLSEIRALAASGQATEHSYRPALERLFKSIDDNLTVINEPRRLTDVGAPDFVFNDKNGVAIGWCEAKDLFKDITKFKVGDYSKEQKARYTKGLPNLIYTNGTDFEFIRKGEVTGFVQIADLIPTLPARPDQFDRLEMLLRDFAQQTPISINTAKQLAEMMAGKAWLIKDRIGKSLVVDTEANDSTDLIGQFQAFKMHLIHDITIADFADIYAETIAYGLFAARLHDTTMDTFNRAEALELLPKSNPFLRSLFVYIAGPNLDDRLRRMIDDLCDVFRACDVGALMQDFGKFTARNDPFLHFYETFLAEYNPAKRKARGVWYTPEPVVNFIVRAVDDVLKTEFGLPMGLADTSKVSIDWDSGQDDLKTGKRIMTKREVHRVQILDPATGTGTFLAEAIKQIAAQVKDVAPAMWSSYVERDLIPRLHGFELLMASYAMCHMKLDMMLTDMGYKPSTSPPRLNVFLTNSLEEGEKLEQNLFGLARDITEEGRKASEIKNDMPIMCVIGNPPYNARSANTGLWITDLIEDYKYVAGEHFREGKHWLHDDYVKFIRFAESMIEKNGEGILGFITNHGYLDNPTFRGMRHHLLQSFDKIIVLDLHGNANKRETAPDGSFDQNVFDIQQGVSVLIAIKTTRSVVKRPRGKPAEIALAKVLRGDLWGSRGSKYEWLWEAGLNGSWLSPVSTASPYFMFTKDGGSDEAAYATGFSIGQLFPINCTGIITARDTLAIDYDSALLTQKVEAFRDDEKSDIEIRASFFPGKTSGKYPAGDSRGWKLGDARKKLKGSHLSNSIKTILYRPFDLRSIYYSVDLVDWGREGVMRHVFEGQNVALLSPRMTADEFSPLVTTGLISNKTASRYDQSYFFPLYLYPEKGTLETERRVNFDPKIYAEIRKRAGLIPPSPSGEGTGVGPVSQAQRNSGTPHPNPSPEGEGLKKESNRAGEELPDELRVFDYIYGVLHSPDYRATYAQFLKIDFPRIPYPASPEIFAHVAEKGGQLRRLHLMEDAAIGATPYPFKGDGDNVVVKPAFAENIPSPRPSPARGEGAIGRVLINANQYFENVPAVAWEFHIGGYQPAQKWLNDRKGRALSFDDVRHYQKIITILIKTDRIMREIELPLG